MNLEAHITISPHVLHESLEGETILLDMSNGTYFGLTPVASRFWQLIAQNLTGKQAVAQILEEFDVEEETLTHDLEELITQLERRKLISQQA